ncbi:uncharacterized protein LOC106374628 [Brassica napus]|uniref:uncharacterized protein LOC106374628 n=1 Tax=Brassica napus TaxID=3708 RepID=UPI0006AA9941|nr:uncharacterized protein LOC106374628 [Brassica napus]
MFGLLRRSSQEQISQHERFNSSTKAFLEKKQNVMKTEYANASNNFFSVQERTQPRRPLERLTSRHREQSRPSRDDAVHDHRRDDQRSYHRSRKLDDRFSRNQQYDDCEKRLLPALQVVEESNRKRKYTSPSSRSEAVSQSPSYSKEKSAGPKPKTEPLSSLSQETRGTFKTSNFICADESVKCHGRSQATKDVPMELNKSNEESKEQLENLFQTGVLVQNKVRSMIIDGGSCANVASSTMVKKLGLETKKRPQPYKLQWLTDNGEMKVTREVVVSFSVGRYEDEVLCDVLPMEATHILLGRPWQFDRQVTYNGLTNRFLFLFKGKNINLVPLSPSEALQDQQHLSKKKDQADCQTVKPRTFLRNALKAKCLLPSSYSDVVLENKQTSDELTHVKPVQSSSLVSFSQELKETPTEEAQKSPAPEKLLEQSASTEPRVIPQSISCQSRKHR